MAGTNKTGGRGLWVVFVFSMGIVLTSFVSVFFPSLILVSDTVVIPGIDPAVPDPYETGPWAAAVAASCAASFLIWFLYRRGALPGFVRRALGALWSFEVSRRTAAIVVIVLLAAYAATSAGELGVEEPYEDYIGVKERLESWSPGQALGSFEPHVRYVLLWSSMIVFGSYKVVPFLASIALLYVTYLLASSISGKRFAGIISMTVLMQSGVFLAYDTTVSYTNFWILLYAASLYMVARCWPLSPVAYAASLPAKALTAAFLPMSIYFMLRSQATARKKAAMAAITCGIIIAIGAISMGSGQGGEAAGEEYDAKEFWMGFTSFAYQLRFDALVMLFCIPLIVGLFVASRRGIRHADSMMILISGMMLVAPLLTGFTNQTNQPYRFVPLVVFFAVGVGVLLSRTRGGQTSR